MRWSALAAAVMLVGCAPAEQGFPKAAAKAECRRVARCDAAAYEDNWGSDFKECVEETVSVFEAWLDLADRFVDCDYDRDEAGEYLRAMGREQCGDAGDDAIDREREDVYECSF